MSHNPQNVIAGAVSVSNCVSSPSRRNHVRVVALMLFVVVCGCGPSDTPAPDPPPLEMTVIVDDMTPPQQGCELLTLHAFNECRNGTWHIVTKGTFLCGQTQVIKEVRVVRTNQPCEAGDIPPSVQTFIAIGIPDACVAPVKLFTFHQLECPNATWNWIAYDLMQCGDGRTYIVRNPSFDRSTTILCTEPPPPN